MIMPTVGRVVWVRRANAIDKRQPEVALICAVHSGALINVVGWDHNGNCFIETSLHLRQDNDEVPHHAADRYAEWMPYQKGQAAKTEALERAAAAPEKVGTSDAAGG